MRRSPVLVALALLSWWVGHPPMASAAGFREQLSGLLPTTCVSGQPFELDASASYYTLLFLGVECPVARQYGARVQELANQFSDQKIQFIGINSNPQDSRSKVAQYQQDFGIEFPLLKDHSQAIAKRFEATRTAEAIVVDATGTIRYRGRIDDQFSPGVTRNKVASHDLRDALQALVQGLPVAIPETTPVGCVITYLKEPSAAPTVTFTKDVAPLLWQHCYECHRAGEIGPFDISDYDELQGWGEMLVEVMEQKRMPPWHASPEYGSFKNERKLPEGMIDLVRRWIDEGMPYGAQVELPAKPTYVDGWRLPKAPDMIVAMGDRPFVVPAAETVEYQYFVVDPGITEDRWVSASQIIPGAPSVVHHSIVFVRPPDGGEFVGIGWLNAYVPGQVPVIYPSGYARKVPAGSKLVFQMHYTPSGIETPDITKIGLNFVDESEVTHQVYTLVAIDQDFEIPPHAPAHVVAAQMQQFARYGELLAISPHMHLRGKAFEVFAQRPDGLDTILKVPHYDFNWQHTYELSQPLSLNDLEGISIAATFDNSKDNPFNPNPDEYVMWGDQTWEEMTLSYFDVAVPAKRQELIEAARQLVTSPSRSADAPPADAAGTDSKALAQQDPQRAEQFADQFLQRYDSNGDGRLTVREVPPIYRDYGFWIVDQDHDGQITREELIQAARGNRGSRN